MNKVLMVGIMAAVILSSGEIVMGEENMVAAGKTVKIHYTLTVNGEIADTSIGKEPLEYVQGKQMIIPALEQQLENMTVGQKKTVVVSAEDGYGLKDDRAVIEIPKSEFIPGEDPKVGVMIQVPTESGDPLVGVVAEVKDTTVVLDFNHPLAGKDLNFDVEIVEVK